MEEGQGRCLQSGEVENVSNWNFVIVTGLNYNDGDKTYNINIMLCKCLLYGVPDCGSFIAEKGIVCQLL